MMDRNTAEVEKTRPRYLEYQKLMGTFKPGDNISELLKGLERMWADDNIYLKDRAGIFRKCVGEEIRKVI